jgi:hypothetical protein
MDKLMRDKIKKYVLSGVEWIAVAALALPLCYAVGFFVFEYLLHGILLKNEKYRVLYVRHRRVFMAVAVVLALLYECYVFYKFNHSEDCPGGGCI